MSDMDYTRNDWMEIATELEAKYQNARAWADAWKKSAKMHQESADIWRTTAAKKRNQIDHLEAQLDAQAARRKGKS